jgi:peptidoglycan/LPS O-acetylase OafA/YrhL
VSISRHPFRFSADAHRSGIRSITGSTRQYGVFVFFLVSGYIVPASLERKGSVHGFWVSRVFRLYPRRYYGGI